MSRDGLYCFTYLLLTANALPSLVGEAVQAHGWLPAGLNLFDVSAIAWLAIAAGLALLWRSGVDERPRQSDWAIAICAMVAAIVPLAPLSAAALTGVALWGWVTGRPHSSGRRAAAIFLSLSMFLIWGRVFLALGSGPLLSADARFVSLISGMPASGNVVEFADGTRFMIAPGCSSLHGISLALILWTTAIAWFDYPVTARLRWTLVLAVIASVLVNGLRLTIIAWNPHDFVYWHVGSGGALFGWLALCAIAGVVYTGIRGAARAS